MGYFFQMSCCRDGITGLPNRKIVSYLCGIALALCFAMQAAGAERFVYEQRDPSQARKKYLSKLIDDKRKVDLAIGNTKTLIDQSRNKPYLPELYLRLAELYVEKSRLAYFIRKGQNVAEPQEGTVAKRTGDTTDTAAASPSGLDQLESNTLKNQAIEIYQRILDNYPDFPDCDKVRFFMAHEYRELGQIDAMIKQYRAIIQQYKKSPYAAEAYLLLGDHLIHKQDLDTAIRHYQAVGNYPDSPANAIARYKLAWCHINKADFKQAIRLFEEAVTAGGKSGNQDVDTYRRVDIRFESLIDMAYCYTEAYKDRSPADALAYFKKYAWSRQVYTAVLEKLAYRYYLKKRWGHAAEIYRRLCLFQEDPDKLLTYTGHIFECAQALGHYANAPEDVFYMVKALGKERYSVHVPQSEKKKHADSYELYARNMITRLHATAREKKSKEAFAKASEAYRHYLDFFKESPVHNEMVANYAEALFSSGAYVESGRQYEFLAGEAMGPTHAKEEKLYGAVISYYTALKNRDQLGFYETAVARHGLQTTGNQYVNDFPNAKHVAEVKFNVAWITYDAGDFDASITAFNDYLRLYPKGKTAAAAVHLVMDAYHQKEDYEGLIRYGRELLSAGRIGDAALRREVAAIVKATESKVVSSLTIAALDDWEKGKADLIDYAGGDNGAAMSEQALLALILSAREKNDFETFFTSGRKLIRQYPRSSQVEQTLNTMIGAAAKMGQFRMLADFLEDFAARFPKHANTADFMYQAAHIRRTLGDYERSSFDFKKFLAAGGTDGGLRGEAVIMIVANARETGDLQGAARIVNAYRKSLTLESRILADARMADLMLVKSGHGAASAFERRAARAYKPQMGIENPELRDAMAAMMYHAIAPKYQQYMRLQLGNTLDNTIVAAKNRLLNELETAYQAVMQYKSPEWALRSCYDAHVVNAAFARFLENAPVPELTPEETAQYRTLVSQKAGGFAEKARQYLASFEKLSSKWEICARTTADLPIRGATAPPAAARGPFTGRSANVAVDSAYMQDPVLGALHLRLMEKPDDPGILTELAGAYLDKGDFLQSRLMIQKACDAADAEGSGAQSLRYNLLGLCYLYASNDSGASDAFREALEIDTGNTAAALNLAALLTYYGHADGARSLYDTVPSTVLSRQETAVVHPRAREFYDEYKRSIVSQ